VDAVSEKLLLPAVLDVPRFAIFALQGFLHAALKATLWCMRVTAAIDTEVGLHLTLVAKRAIRVLLHPRVACKPDARKQHDE
jgi:hypothetical protein